MIKVAITGGICSGKTTICKYLESLNFKIFYADDVAKTLANNSIDLQKNIITEFGNESYIDSKYNSKYIAEIVFNDPIKLNKLNEIFKPFIDYTYSCFLEMYSSVDVIFYESALIFEHNRDSEFDFVTTVYANESVVISRLKSRNDFNDNEIDIRLKNQMNPLVKIGLSNFSISTVDGKFYKEQVFKMLNKIYSIHKIQ